MSSSLHFFLMDWRALLKSDTYLWQKTGHRHTRYLSGPF